LRLAALYYTLLLFCTARRSEPNQSRDREGANGNLRRRSFWLRLVALWGRQSCLRTGSLAGTPAEGRNHDQF